MNRKIEWLDGIDNRYYMCSCGNVVPISCICKCQVKEHIKRASQREVTKFTSDCIEYFHKLVANNRKHIFDDDDIQRELMCLCEQYYLKNK